MIPIGFQKRMAPSVAPTPPGRCQGRGLCAREAFDHGATDAVIGEQDFDAEVGLDQLRHLLQ